ncbi:MAG TPA: isochorismatase family protein [Bryobacteraceae bacterium]|nr:isochorismatase family protein [Bryobacteraceae bacterium]
MKLAFFDIDTQIDFLFPAGALYVPGAERLIPALSRLNHFAAAHGIPLVSSTCAHSEDDPEFRDWPPHCIAGTVGHLKPPETLLEKRAVINVAPGEYAIDGAQQILFEKNQLDITSSPNFQPLLNRLAADAYVVYGVVTEYCVRFAALALLATGKPVSLVTDAIQTLSAQASENTIREFTARGGRLTTVTNICA